MKLETTESFAENWAREWKERTDADKAKLLETLAASPTIKEITIEYDGFGDEGCINEITFADAANNPIETTEELRSLVEEVVSECLPGGWGDNEGAYGTCTIDAESGTMSFDHWARSAVGEGFTVELKGGE